MNPDQPSREQIEVRITALLLGELPPDEAQLLRYTMAQDPALQALHDELELAMGLVREAAKHPAEEAVARSAPLRLSAERRRILLAHFRTPQGKAGPLFWLRRIKLPTARVVVTGAVIIIALTLVAVISIPNFVASRATSPAS
jgi:anti-sigma factor RsiW